jgi:hypothetical protein
VTDLPECPVCVHLDCPDCGHRQSNVGRVWVKRAGKVACPKCGHGGGLTQTPPRHHPGSGVARSHAEMADEVAELLKEGQP